MSFCHGQILALELIHLKNTQSKLQYNNVIQPFSNNVVQHSTNITKLTIYLILKVKQRMTQIRTAALLSLKVSGTKHNADFITYRVIHCKCSQAEWIFSLWRFRCRGRLNALLHWSHGYGLVPECVLSCLLKSLDVANDLQQVSQTNGLTLKWNLLCVFRLDACVKHLLQRSHL